MTPNDGDQRPMAANCPHCGKPINPAALLGAMGKGVRKQFSAAERKRRAARMAEALKARWRKPANDSSSPTREDEHG